MAQNFIGCGRDQSFLMPPDVRDWVPEGHFVWFVLEAVEEMDLGGFYDAYRRDGMGRPGYDPAMMGALLLYSYARGIRSARKIERAYEEDVAFRVIAMLEKPDHATIARSSSGTSKRSEGCSVRCSLPCHMPGNVADRWQSRQSGIVFWIRVAGDVMHCKRHV
jgi:transposase